MLKLYSIIDIFLLKLTYLLSNLGLYRVFYKRSYSQEGEDMILSNIFVKSNLGFYVDVGAHHPYKLSNTYFFYQKGWRGINIEPNTSLIKLFNDTRRRDINLNMAISKRSATKKYYMFSEPALNGFTKSLSKIRSDGDAKLIGFKMLRTIPLSKVLDEQNIVNNEIDILSVDTEGMEYEILISNNWFKYRPKSIVVEILSTNVEELMNNEVYDFLKKQHYVLYAKSGNSCVFLERNFMKSIFS